MIEVLLVTGGRNWHEPLDSTEILETPGGSWRILTSARLPRHALRAGSANNVVFIFGKKCLNVGKYSVFHPFISYQEDLMNMDMSSTQSSPSTRKRKSGSQLEE